LEDEEGFLEEGANEVTALSGGEKEEEKSFSPILCEILEKSRVRKKPRYKIKHMWKALSDAADRRRKCFLRYKKLKKDGGGTFEYYVAPYSFRNKPGGEVLFAYDFIDGHIKSFFKDRVTGVHVTKNRFVPKWDVEVGSEKSLSVYESFRVLGELVKERDKKTRTIEEFMNEGLSADRKVTPGTVDPEQLRMGIKVEYEHTKDPELARKIALDHLAEFPFYYSALADMERRLRAQKSKGDTEKDSMGSPKKPVEAVKSPNPKITKPSASLRP
jgi:predicted DNA-binding transcriptional regulator YafY